LDVAGCNHSEGGAMPKKPMSIDALLLSEEKQERQLSKALKRIGPDWLQKANVVAYGIGDKVTKKKSTDRLAAIAFVEKKVAAGKLSRRDRIPKTLLVGRKRIPTDVQRLRRVEATGDPTANREDSRNKMEMGHSISSLPHDTDGAASTGTSGAVVTDPHQPGSQFMLSAGHVLLATGNDIIQRGKLDGGQNYVPPPPPGSTGPPNPLDRVGNVTKMVAGVDAGIAECMPMSPTIVGLGAPTGRTRPKRNLPVQKSGRTTGVTSGRITATDVVFSGGTLAPAYAGFPQVISGSPTTPVPADAKMGTLFIVDGAFLMPGDSGSLIVAGDLPALIDYFTRLVERTGTKHSKADIDALANRFLMKAVGLGILADVGTNGIGVHIDTVLTALSVELV
jgi:hypothetical protein